MRLVSWWRRYRLDGVVCAVLRAGRCDGHEMFDGPCRCLEPAGHRGGHVCGQGARWSAEVKV